MNNANQTIREQGTTRRVAEASNLPARRHGCARTWVSRAPIAKGCIIAGVLLALACTAPSEPAPLAKQGEGWVYRPAKPAVDSSQTTPQEALEIELPDPSFSSTPIDYWSPNFENVYKPRPAFLAPEQTTLLSRDRPVTCSDVTVSPDKLKMVTDGDKRFDSESVLLLKPGLRFVQIDLGSRSALQAIVFWHFHERERVYKDVIVVVSDEPEFKDAVVLFNNDYDKSAGLGQGSDKEYVDKAEGRLVDAAGAAARYVRLYSNGNTDDDGNTYIEVEVYGKRLE